MRRLRAVTLIAALALSGCSGAATPTSSLAPPPTALATPTPVTSNAATAPAPATATTSGSTPSAAPIDYTDRPGWILLEHVGTNAPDGSGPMQVVEGHSLWLIRADGTELHELAPDRPTDGKFNPVWSRDGKRIAFESIDRVLIYETDVEGSALALVSNGCSGDAETCVEGSAAYSPDASRLAVSASYDGLRTGVIGVRDRCDASTHCSIGGGSFHIVHATIDSTQIPISTGWIEGLTWSPDGSSIAYHVVAKDADNKPLGSEIWIVSANTNPGPDDLGAHKVPLPDGINAGDPDWSPDGSLLVFSSEPIHDWNFENVPDHADIYTVRPDGSDLQRLTHDAGSGAPSWTSDGKILFYQAVSQGALWLMDADGSNAAPVFPDGPSLAGSATGWSIYGYWQPIP